MRLVDPHVHLRDWDQASKETVAHGLAVAARCGIGGVFEMPNTSPPLTTAAAVERRIAEADVARAAIVHAPFHGLYIGLTEDPEQVAAAVELWRRLRPRVVGFKLYAGHSTGRMGVTATAAQLVVWRALAAAGYQGVVAIHAEREDLLHPERWNPASPVSHSDARPALAEITSVQTQISFAEAAGFRGTMHICHISCPETVEIIERERAALPFRLTGATTPHHILLDTDDVHRLAGAADHPPAAEFNVNPPLRDPSRRVALADLLVKGSLDWIESDHAPHTLADKAAGASGLPGIPAFRLLAEELGRILPPQRVKRLAATAVLETFDIDPELIPDREIEPWPEPGTARTALWSELAAEYPWDPYRACISGPPRIGR